jgi:hypothetical protein
MRRRNSASLARGAGLTAVLAACAAPGRDSENYAMFVQTR